MNFTPGSSFWRLSLFFLLSSAVIATQCFDQLHLYQSSKVEVQETSHNYFNLHNLRSKRDISQNQSLPIINDSFVYYHSQYFKNGKDKYWLELSNNPAAVKDSYLSEGSLRSKKFDLEFTFPYYGHPLKKVWITTGGFLYVGDVETSLKMKVMYVAPLMAYFNNSINPQLSAIYHLSNATQFTAQWTDVKLQNSPSSGAFTFQCTLHKDGRIVFAYKTLPFEASKIPEPKEHHVKVGISDAFIGYRWWIIKGLGLRKVRVFYIYHSVDYKKDNIKTGSSLLLTPLPNCIIGNNCTHCMSITGQTSFTCGWCEKLKRCSDGLDRHRVEWFDSSCNTESVDKFQNCGSVAKNKSDKSKVFSNEDKKVYGSTIGAIVGIILLVIVIIGVGSWCFYAYTHPVSRSGLFLIDLRRKPGELFRRANNTATSTTGATTGASKA